MKKLFVLIMTVLMSFTIFAAGEDIDTTFTFQSFVPTSEDVIFTEVRSSNENGSNITYPLFVGQEDIVKRMNKSIEKQIRKYRSNKNTSYRVTYSIEGSNAYFVSVLFEVEKRDSKTGTTISYDALTFNTKDGKELSLKDLFVPGYQDALKGALSDRVAQFGIETVENFDFLKKYKFYMTDDAVVIFYDPEVATNYGDGTLFIPLITLELIGILK